MSVSSYLVQNTKCRVVMQGLIGARATLQCVGGVGVPEGRMVEVVA